MIKIAIVDSGVNREHESFKNDNLRGYSLKIGANGDVIKENDFSDSIGHGTAIYYLIKKFTRNIGDIIEITNIRIFFNNTRSIDQNAFELILEYISNNCNFDIINFSLGIIQCGNVAKMQRCIDKMHNNGTIIVAAFDNNGAMSFPAALKNVIGVDSVRGKRGMTGGFVGIENSPINITVDESNFKVAWTFPDYCIVHGSSFSCGLVTAKIATQLANEGQLDFNKLCDIIERRDAPIEYTLPFSIGRYSVFPISKEIQSIVMYENLVCGQLIHCYSAKYSGLIGRSIVDCFPHIKSNRIIENIDNIDWDDIDTLVLGHLDELSKICGRGYKDFLIKDAIKRGKRVYCFDENKEIDRIENSSVYFPYVDSSYIEFRRNKLYKTSKPILCIAGTSSSQGKFTLQLLIRKKLIEAGYTIGQIGTEPTSYLFGFDACFPCGYNSSMYLTPNETISAVNQAVWQISQKNVDIIIVGVQSGLLPFDNSNAMYFPLIHQIFYEAIQPDCIFLCINTYDSIDYICRTIKVAESLSTGKVIGLVCYPIDFDVTWRGMFGAKKRISSEREIALKQMIEERTALKLYMLDKEEDIVSLINAALNYLKK